MVSIAASTRKRHKHVNGGSMADAYIVAAARTAGARKAGRLSGWHPADLAGKVLDALLDRTQADPQLIDDVIMGCVSQVGEQALNVARNAVLSSRLPESVPGTSVDRQCGSSQQALHFAAQAVMSGAMNVVIAAGVESMSRVPMGLSSQLPAKNGFGMPTGEKMATRYPGVQFSQFTGAEMMARKYDLSKDVLDEFAFQSHSRAIAATRAGHFTKEVLPLEISLPDGSKQLHEVDEGIRFEASLEGIRGVKLLVEGGRITAATSSQI
jgi:acetyl-CoA C-acetyltransferase